MKKYNTDITITIRKTDSEKFFEKHSKGNLAEGIHYEESSDSQAMVIFIPETDKIEISEWRIEGVPMTLLDQGDTGTPIPEIGYTDGAGIQGTLPCNQEGTPYLLVEPAAKKSIEAYRIPQETALKIINLDQVQSLIHPTEKRILDKKDYVDYMEKLEKQFKKALKFEKKDMLLEDKLEAQKKTKILSSQLLAAKKLIFDIEDIVADPLSHTSEEIEKLLKHNDLPSPQDVFSR